jgi:hypothetical protein
MASALEASLVPTTTQSNDVGHASESIDWAAGRRVSVKFAPLLAVDKNVASMGVLLASAEVAARPAQKPSDGQSSE